MHPCLQVSELAARIAEAIMPRFREMRLNGMAHYNPQFPGSSGVKELQASRRALSALSQTCRTLHEPALDVLWYYQLGVHHLISCMPADLWTLRQAEVYGPGSKYPSIARTLVCFIRRSDMLPFTQPILALNRSQRHRTQRLGTLRLLRRSSARPRVSDSLCGMVRSHVFRARRS